VGPIRGDMARSWGGVFEPEATPLSPVAAGEWGATVTRSWGASRELWGATGGAAPATWGCAQDRPRLSSTAGVLYHDRVVRRMATVCILWKTLLMSTYGWQKVVAIEPPLTTWRPPSPHA